MRTLPAAFLRNLRKSYNTASTRVGARHAALLCGLYGTRMTATELAQLAVADVLEEGGGSRRECLMRPAITCNGTGRSTKANRGWRYLTFGLG